MNIRSLALGLMVSVLTFLAGFIVGHGSGHDSGLRAASVVQCGSKTCDVEISGFWEGNVYPDRNNLAESIFIGEFNRLELCSEKANEALIKMGRPFGDYECGLNCKPSEHDGVKVCEATCK